MHHSTSGVVTPNGLVRSFCARRLVSGFLGIQFNMLHISNVLAIKICAVWDALEMFILAGKKAARLVRKRRFIDSVPSQCRETLIMAAKCFRFQRFDSIEL